jgi:pyruvate/2-oxoacid:ferredoxin oxidoreductase beta subunit
MITSVELATEISAAGERFVEKLSKCLIEAQSSCSPEEYEQFKKAVGSVVGTLELDMLWPLYRKHPGLEPENLRDWKNET